MSDRFAQSCPHKLSARCQTDSFNPHSTKPHPLTTVSDTRTQDSKPNPKPEPITTSPKLSARCQTDSFNPLSTKPHPPNTVSDTRTQNPKPNPTPEPRPQAQPKHLNPKPPTKVQIIQDLPLKQKTPRPRSEGFFLKENPLRFFTKPTEHKQTPDTRQ